MLVVVPGEERLAVGSGVFGATKPVRESGPIFQRLELRLRVRVVVRDVRTAVAPLSDQVNQQIRHRLGAHGGAPIGMQRQRAGDDAMQGHCVADQLFGQYRAFAVGDHPAHDVATVDVQNHVKMEAGPLRGSLELGDVPAPHLIGAGRHQFGFGVCRMNRLVASLAHATAGRPVTIHGSYRPQVPPLVQQHRVDRCRGAVDEALAVKRGQQQFTFLRTQCQRRARPRCAWPRWPVQRSTVTASPLARRRTALQAQCLTGPADTNRRR